jgi:hypothetical protein
MGEQLPPRPPGPPVGPPPSRHRPPGTPAPRRHGSPGAPAPPPATPAFQPPTHPASPPTDVEDEQKPVPHLGSFLGMIRSIREDAINLIRALDRVESSAKLVDDAARAAEFESTLAAARKDFTRDRPHIEKLLNQLDYIMQMDPELYDWAGDVITRMENHWYKAVDLWPNSKTLVANLSLAKEPLNEVIYNSALLTVPDRLDQHLATLHNGQPLNFDDAFADELPLKDQRTRILTYLSAHPAAIHGIVDADAGLVYNASPKKSRRLATAFIIGVPVIAGILASWLLIPRATWIPGLPSNLNGGQLAIGFIVALTGTLVHYGIGAIKEARQAQAATAPRFLAIENWLTWIHIRDFSIGIGIIVVWVAYAATLYITKHIDYLTAFLAGYSSDSIYDLVVPKFTKAASTRVETLTQQLSS